MRIAFPLLKIHQLAFRNCPVFIKGPHFRGQVPLGDISHCGLHTARERPAPRPPPSHCNAFTCIKIINVNEHIVDGKYMQKSTSTYYSPMHGRIKGLELI